MAVSKKGSRKIVVDNSEFRWRATGNDGWISLVVWPVENENSRLVGSVEYHSTLRNNGDGSYTSLDQVVITNKVVREIILHYGVEKIISNTGQIDMGSIEDIIDINIFERGEYRGKK